MSTLTKEWLHQTIAEYEACRDEMPFGLDTNSAIELEAFKIALASLEAEPVGYINRFTGRVFTLEEQPGAATDVQVYMPVYTAPPEPVSVPDELLSAMEEVLRISDRDHDAWHKAKAGIVSCRAAMLQGAENVESPTTIQTAPDMDSSPKITESPSSNSPAIQDGWVACSERMPDIGTEIFYFCQDDGLRDCGIVSSANFSDKGDAQLYVHAEGYDLRFGVDITHWMPLPAAPQQEGLL